VNDKTLVILNFPPIYQRNEGYWRMGKTQIAEEYRTDSILQYQSHPIFLFYAWVLQHYINIAFY